MKRKKLITAIILALATATLLATPVLARRGREGACGMGRGLGPEFTTEQKEEIEEIRAKYEDERVELHNRVAAMHLDLEEILDGDEPDFRALERMIDDISTTRADLMKLKLRQHQEVRSILDEDQRSLFDAGFARRFGRGLVMGGHGKADCGMRPGMGHPGKGHPGMGGRGMCRPGMRAGTGAQGPMCPWTQDDVPTPDEQGGE